MASGIVNAARFLSTSLGTAPSTVNWTINGGWVVTTRTITANLTVDTTKNDYVILCNQAAAITVTLPAATAGRTLIIKDISGAAATNNISAAPTGGAKIEGLTANKVIQANYGSMTLTADGTDWWMTNE